MHAVSHHILVDGGIFDIDRYSLQSLSLLVNRVDFNLVFFDS